MGTHHMRSTNRIAEQIRLFPQYLRQSGYYTSNNSKTDYNFQPYPEGGWNEINKGHWRNREPGQPFFSVFNIGTSHESSLHGSKVVPEYLEEPFTLPPYHPDVPEIRSNWVEYYRILTKMDAQVGQILDQLAADGLADDTIVFYYGDNGGILPRSKRYVYDTGVHVPLVVRFPERFRDLATGGPGTRITAPVTFVDFAPTVLSLAGVEIPGYMQGRAFLGHSRAEPRQYVYPFRGRMDERYDMMRTVRDARYKYIRNYMPHRVYGQHLDYLWKMPATQAWERAFKGGKTNEVQSRFWKPKPTEELFDVAHDPWEVDNLADKPEHHALLERLRAENRRNLLATRDAGFLPESEMMDRAARHGLTIYEMARDDRLYPLERLIDAADLAGRRNPESVPRLVAMLQDEDPGIRYWGAAGCLMLAREAKSADAALVEALKDPTPCVRITAAEAVAAIGHEAEAIAVLTAALEAENPRAVLEAINALDALGDAARPALPALERATKHKDDYVRRASSWVAEKLGSP
jgi:arylsulfatase A-like enzyme